MMVGHLLLEINLFGLLLLAVAVDVCQAAARAVGARDKNVVARHDRRRTVGRAVVGPAVVPKQPAGIERHAKDALLSELHDLPHAGNVSHHRRGVMSVFFQAACLPHQSAVLLVERDDRPLGSAGGDDHQFAFHQRRFAVAPAGPSAAKILDQVDMPNGLARGRIEARHVAVAAFGIQPRAVDGRRAARAVAHAVAIAAIVAAQFCGGELAVFPGIMFASRRPSSSSRVISPSRPRSKPQQIRVDFGRRERRRPLCRWPAAFRRLD